MSGSHHPVLVILSALIAMLASYTALQLAGRVTAASGWARQAWLASGSVAMGVGIWSMHFVAMLAFRLPVPITYDVPLWLLSIVIAILASCLALFIASREHVNHLALAAGAIVMGTAIAAMHYTGMAAVRINGRIEYDPTLVTLSIAIAIFCAFTALVLARRFREVRTRRGAWAMGASGVIMGIAISGMHYTGMAAARFILLPDLHVAHDANVVASRELAVAVVVGTMLILSLALLGSLVDSHLRRRDAEAVALRESRRAMATLLDNLQGMAYRSRPEPLAGHRGTRQIEFASDGAFELTGYRPEDLVGNRSVSFMDLIHPTEVVAVGRELHSALQDRRAFQLTYRLRTAAGQEKWLFEQGQGVFTADGELVAVEGFITDITERRRSSELHRHLATIVESTNDAIVSEALDGTILTWNRGAEQVYGYSAETVLGRPGSILLPEDRLPEEARLIERVVHGETITQLETVRRRQDESEIHVALTVSPIRDAAGTIVAVSLISQDITERKRVEVELRRARDAAEAANRTKSEFLASMSHELRTPLNSVIGFANVLRKNKGANLRDVDLQYLDRIAGSGKHLLRLINDVLDLSKIEAGKMELERAPVSVASVVHDTVAELQGGVRDGVTLRALVAPSGLLIESDARKLKQVLINLVGNALKFTEQGTITIAVAVDRTTGCPLRIDVHDTGVGIPQERLASIFKPFEQAESGTARRFGGTGLGLAIATSLCELLGYRLEVDSTPGVGSVFSIVLKADQAGAMPHAHLCDTAAADVSITAPALASSYDSGPSYEHRRVLVIDDDADARTILSDHLTELGCTVVQASSGEEGLRVAQEQRPDLITLDLLMPGMTGWAVLRELRDAPELREIPVVVVSGLAERGTAATLGVVDLLSKPLERAHIERALRRSLTANRRRVLVIDDDEDARVLVCACLQDSRDIEIRTAANGREAMMVLQTFAPDVLVLDLMMPELDGLGFLAKVRDELPHITPSVVVVTAKDLNRLERQRLDARTLAVFRKDGELEASLQRVLHELWGSGAAERVLVSADRA